MGLPSDPLASRAFVSAEDLGAWMVEYGPALRRFFSKRVGAAEADDLVQEVFLRLQARASGDAVENVERYLFRIANNVIVDRRRHEVSHGLTYLDPFDNIFDLPDEVSPERALSARQMLDELGAAIRDLPPRTREAFVFHRFEEMTYPAIAQRMGISITGVEKLIKRALAQLGQKMERRR